MAFTNRFDDEFSSKGCLIVGKFRSKLYELSMKLMPRIALSNCLHIPSEESQVIHIAYLRIAYPHNLNIPICSNAECERHLSLNVANDANRDIHSISVYHSILYIPCKLLRSSASTQLPLSKKLEHRNVIRFGRSLIEIHLNLVSNLPLFSRSTD